MPAILRLTREGFGIELRRGTFNIVLDGKGAGSIKYRETVEKIIEPGHHELHMQVGRYSSRDYSFNVADGDIVNLRCHGAMVWPRYVASIFKPDLAISIKQG